MNTRIAGCRSAAADELTVAAVMVTTPKTMEVTLTVSQAVEAFANPHVHMLLLTEDGVLKGAYSATILTHEHRRRHLQPASQTCRSEPWLPRDKFPRCWRA